MILSSLFSSGESLATKSGGYRMSEVPGLIHVGQESAAGVRVDEGEALSLSAVFAAVNLLSAVTAALPLQVFKRSGRNKEPATSNPAYKVLHTQFNDEQTAILGRRTMEIHRLMWGNAYAEIGWDGGGNPRALWPIEAWRVRPKRDESTKKLYYLIDGTRRVAADDMIHVPLFSTDGVQGCSFVEFALQSLGVGIASQEHAARWFGNGSRPGGILNNPGTPKKEDRDEFRQSWERAQGGKHAHRVAVTWGGWTYTPGDGTVDPTKAQLLEQRRFTVEEVSRWFNIPPHLLRELARATNNNIEHQGIDAVIYTFGPVLVMYEQEYDRKLLTPPSTFSKHNVTALLRGDSAARSQFYRELFNIGVFSINDILELEDRNPITGGDVHFVPLNMQPLEQATKPAAEETPAANSNEAEAPTEQPATKAGEDVQATALNGAQVAALLTISQEVVAGNMPGNGAREMLSISFPAVGKPQIDDLVKALEGFAANKASKPDPQPAPSPPQSPPVEEPPAEPPTDEEPMRPLLTETLRRLARVECNALRRIAEKPGRLFAWLDEFYPLHEGKLAEAIAPVLKAAKSGKADLAAEWCKQSREELLALAGAVKHAEFAESASALASRWESERPERIANEVLSEK